MSWDFNFANLVPTPKERREDTQRIRGVCYLEADRTAEECGPGPKRLENFCSWPMHQKGP